MPHVTRLHNAHITSLARAFLHLTLESATKKQLTVAVYHTRADDYSVTSVNSIFTARARPCWAALINGGRKQ